MKCRVLLIVAVVAGCALVVAAQGTLAAAGGGQDADRPPRRPPLTMTSTAWEDGGVIPDKYTQAASLTAPSPALTWTNVPAGTQSFMLLLRDLNAVIDKGARVDMTRWLIWNIPGTALGLPEGVPEGDLPDGSHQVSLRSNGYVGPGAPAGPFHHYAFELYALNTKLNVPAGTPAQVSATRMAVINAMDGHVLAKSVLVARFHK